ncbi:MAG: aminotransferase class I/II-fold pyridoxal phosphate-dependent enzyme, partial [Halieaceae bacterium]|nr:aminotransferase class I/II-fold pyridoxal phosphate-dependent enzyme [Halieaceae bacterium]
GDVGFNDLMRDLVFGAGADKARIRTAQTPGGCGALRLLADLVAAARPDATVHIPDPTWVNHEPLLASSGLKLKSYSYFDRAGGGVRFEAMVCDLAVARRGDVVLLHGCCHNPTGVDLIGDDWTKVADLCAQKKLLPLLDFAYQGFAQGVEEDAVGLRTLAKKLPELMVCASFSKNFGLYNERVGSLTVVGGSAAATGTVQSQVKACIRRNYSNP